MSVAYLACPYSDPDPRVKELRHMLATQVAFELMQKGQVVYSPLTHNIPISRLGVYGWVNWKDFDLTMLAKCDRLIVIKIPGWDESKGVLEEIAYAKERGIPIEWLEMSEEKLSQLAIKPS